jgi:hypothetical protein
MTPVKFTSTSFTVTFFSMKSKMTTDDGGIAVVTPMVYPEASHIFFISIDIAERVDQAFVISSTIGYALYVQTFSTTFEKSAVFP